MALVLPLLSTMLFGVIDFGRLFNAEIQLSQAARRVPASPPSVRPPAIPSPERSQPPPPPASGAGGAVTGTATVCPAAPAAGADGVVTVRFTFTFFLPLFPDRTLTQTARMRCGG